jgi:glycosyltransferase involved in cell wall biosynthesis
MSCILMVSPHPTYSPRGTPISVLNRCRALSALGHDVDLVTYGIGEDVQVRGLRYLRAPVPGIRSVKVGPSAAKLPLDLAVFIRTLFVLLRHPRRYDVLHSHEEAGPVGGVLARLFRLKHVYGNYGFGPRHGLRRFARWIEDRTICSADVVIAHFASLSERVAAAGRNVPCVVVHNVGLVRPATVERAAALRQRWETGTAPVAVYVGTFEAYQGLERAIDAIPATRSRVHLVLAGGTDEQQGELRRHADTVGVGHRVHVIGRLSPADVPDALHAADVLVSPRATGTNTPLKIFEYLQSGRPIVATAIASHTAVLDEQVAILTDPSPAALAVGLDHAVRGGQGIARMTAAAARRAADSYSARSYLDGVAAAYRRLGPRGETAVTDLDSATAEMVDAL